MVLVAAHLANENPDEPQAACDGDKQHVQKERAATVGTALRHFYPLSAK